MTESARHSGKDLKTERTPPADRGRIGFDHRIELHRLVTVLTRPVKDMTAKRAACVLLPPGGVDNESRGRRGHTPPPPKPSASTASINDRYRH
jgi:hypothetical protein